ncbi:MAG: hypothetical protein NC453_16810 [Muribaculum sp.]|nr:hypothetical protein [Muribaculum sp.]
MILYREPQALKRPVNAKSTRVQVAYYNDTFKDMKQISKKELLGLLGGAMTECAFIQALANCNGESWTDDQWDSWEKLFYRYC